MLTRWGVGGWGGVGRITKAVCLSRGVEEPIRRRCELLGRESSMSGRVGLK